MSVMVIVALPTSCEFCEKQIWYEQQGKLQMKNHFYVCCLWSNHSYLKNIYSNDYCGYYYLYHDYCTGKLLVAFMNQKAVIVKWLRFHMITDRMHWDAFKACFHEQPRLVKLHFPYLHFPLRTTIPDFTYFVWVHRRGKGWPSSELPLGMALSRP